MSESGEKPAFDRILDYLGQTRGFDFTAYKPTSLQRRVVKRMQAINVDSYEEYFDYLQVHPGEFSSLFNTILINVTSFFRDPDVWHAIEENVLPQLVKARNGSQIRIWSAGSASGQEAYTIAMLLAERIGIDAFRERVKLYATDVDEEALTEARHAVYSSKQIAELPDALAAKYFDKTGDLYTFNRDLRRSVIFGRHDLIQDAPVSKVDLLLCRNTLMYFNAEAQGRIMARFYFSLAPGGFLVLGRAEMLFSHAAMFQAVDLKRRIFTTVPRVNNRERLLMLAQAGWEDDLPPALRYDVE